MQICSFAPFATKLKYSTLKAIAEHREAAFGLLASRLVLNHIPVLDENPILDSQDVHHDPISGLAESGESAMHHDEISVGHDDARLIPESWRQPFDEVEQPFAPLLDVSTVLDVARGPILLGFGVIPFVEKRVERFEDQGLVS